MPDTKLSNLSAAAALSATDIFYVVQSAGVGGLKMTGTQLFALPSALVVSWNGDTGIVRTSAGVFEFNNGTKGTPAAAPGITIPNAASGAGSSFTFTGSSAFSGSAANGGSFVFAFGAGDGSGVAGQMRLNSPTTVDVTATLLVTSGTTVKKGIVVQGAASQPTTTPWIETQKSDGTVGAALIGPANFTRGAVVFGGYTSSFGAIATLNSTATSVIAGLADGSAATNFSATAFGFGVGLNNFLYSPATLVVAVNANTVGSGTAGWLQNAAGSTRVVNDFTNATATMANLTNTSQTLISGRKYSGKLCMFISNSTAAEGAQFDLNGGTAGFSSVEFGIAGNLLGATVTVPSSTALGTAVAITVLAGTTDVYVEVPFSGVCNGSGTLLPRAAEASHATGTLTVRGLSFMLTEDMAN